jgi:hypothetical protein
VFASQIKWVLCLCQSLGLNVNLSKSDLVYPRRSPSSGNASIHFCTYVHRVFPSEKGGRSSRKLSSRSGQERPAQLASGFAGSHVIHGEPGPCWPLPYKIPAALSKIPMGSVHIRKVSNSPGQARMPPGFILVVDPSVPTHNLPHNLEVYTDRSTQGDCTGIGELCQGSDPRQSLTP